MKNTLILVLVTFSAVLPVEAGLSASGTWYKKAQLEEATELAQSRLSQPQAPEAIVSSQGGIDSVEKVALAALTLTFSLSLIKLWTK